jgi:hypothetical protein
VAAVGVSSSSSLTLLTLFRASGVLHTNTS